MRHFMRFMIGTLAVAGLGGLGWTQQPYGTGQSMSWTAAGGCCPQCGSTTCSGLECCPGACATGFRGARNGASCGPQTGRLRDKLRIGGGLNHDSYPAGRLQAQMLRGCQCQGRGCSLCRKTGHLCPGYARAATLGWMDHGGCLTCQPSGYPHGANPYPFPWDCQPPSDPSEGYTNLGNTCGGPYWFDVLVQAVVLTRSGQADQPLTSNGIAGLGPPDLVLSTQSADFDYEPGFLITGRYQCNAVYNLEATYMGGLDWDDRAVATSDTDSLYSVFSDFGNDPFGGFEETDQAAEQSIYVACELDSVELNYRRSWASPNYRMNGSWFWGARYIRFEDSLIYGTVVNEHVDPINTTDPDDPVIRGPASSQYSILAVNDMVGPQIGTSLVGCLLPGFAVGGEAKAGIFGNGADQNSSINASTFANPILESASDTELSYATEGTAYLIWQFHPMMKLRGGYQVLFLSGIATASSNFNSEPPFADGGTRTVVLNHDDQSIFHGGNLGLEIGW